MIHHVSTLRGTSEVQTTLNEWRAKALYIVLAVVAIAGLPAYVSPVINASQVTPLLWVYLLVYLAFVGLAVLPRLDIRLRGWAFILLAYANAVASFARVGLAGSGRLYLITMPVLATILIGSWAGYTTAALSLIVFVVFAALAQVGVLSDWLTVQANPVTLGFWIEAGAALLVFLMILVVLVERFYSLHVQTLAASHQARTDLEQLAQKLQADISERKRVEAALRDSEDKFRRIVEFANVGIAIVQDARFRFVNPFCAAMYGYTADELLNTEFTRYCAPEERDRIAGFSAKRMKGEPAPPRYETAVLHKDGQRVYVDVSVGMIPHEGRPASFAYLVDMTERKRAEQALQERLAFEQVITSISTEFINLGPDEIDAGIRHALQVIGDFTGDDRSYVFQFSEDGMRMNNTHEWCRATIEPQLHNLQAQPVETLAWSVARLKRLEVVHIPRVVGLPPEASVDREQMQGQGIQSLILVPMLYRGKAVGFVGFDSVRRERGWTEDDIALLRIVSEIFANALEHKRAQAALRNSEMWFRAVFEAAPIGIHVTSWQDGVAEGEQYEIETNRTYQQMLGYTGQEFVRLRLEETSHPEDAVTDRRLYYELVSGKRQRYQIEKRYIAKDGRMFWGRYSVSAVRGEDGKLMLIIGTVEDIEEQKLAQDALRKSEALFRAVFEGAGIGITVGGVDGKQLKSNPALARIFGYSEDELLHLSGQSISFPEEWEKQRPLRQELTAGQRDQYQIEKRYIRKDGQVIWGRLTHSIARGEKGEPLFMIAMVEDITAQKQTQQALESAYQTLERRVQERTRELATLNAIAAVVSRSLDLKEVLRDALDKTLEITQMGCGGSYRLEGEGEQAHLNPLVYRGLSDEFVRFAGRLPLQGSGVQAAAGAGQPLVWQVQTSPAEPAMQQALLHEGVELVVSVPLMAKGKLVGAIQLGARETRAFAPEELALLAAIGQQVGMAVENARLYEQAQQSATFAERSRLARELHDSVTQSLYSLTLYAEAAARMMQDQEHAQAADALREMRDTAQEALREMRLLIFQLRPLALEKSGLAAALQARLDAVETRGGIRAKLAVEGASGAAQLAAGIQEELYHIAQEALNNALKHAHPRQVRVGLQFDQDAVYLQIADDGAGFELASVSESGGLGLPGMRERAERIGAELRIKSAPGQGTQVTVRAPYTLKTEEAR